MNVIRNTDSSHGSELSNSNKFEKHRTSVKTKDFKMQMVISLFQGVTNIHCKPFLFKAR